MNKAVPAAYRPIMGQVYKEGRALRCQISFGITPSDACVRLMHNVTANVKGVQLVMKDLRKEDPVIMVFTLSTVEANCPAIFYNWAQVFTAAVAALSPADRKKLEWSDDAENCGSKHHRETWFSHHGVQR